MISASEIKEIIQTKTNDAKLAELKRVQDFVLNQLFDDNKKFKANLKITEYPWPSFEPQSHTWFDTTLVSKIDIMAYFGPMGIVFDNPTKYSSLKISFDKEFFMSYVPETKTVTYKTLFGLKTKSKIVGLTVKDRLKLAILNMYPSYSIDELENILTKKGENHIFADGAYLCVSPKDPWYFAMLNYPKYQKSAEIIKNSPSTAFTNDYIIEIN